MSSALPTGLVEEVRDALVRQGAPFTPQSVASALRAAGRPVGDATVLVVHEALRAEVVGAGVLEPLLHTPGVTDVLVNGADQVWLDRGAGLEPAGVRIADEESLRRLAQRLVASGGRRLDDAAPYADVRLPDGTRCHAVLSPLARPGTALSLRVPHRTGLSLEDLAAAGTLSDEGLTLVRALTRRAVSFLISGGTGSGKTTLLAAILSELDRDLRLVLVEDSSELRPAHPHVVAMEGRPPNIEGTGAIGLRELVRQALRMRPDRLVVGEVRGAEVVDLLAALNTGHEGGCGTVHANSAVDVPARIEALALAAGLARDAAHSQFASAIGAVLHVQRDAAAGHQRRLSQIGVPVRRRDGLVDLQVAVSFAADGALTEGPALDLLLDRLEP